MSRFSPSLILPTEVPALFRVDMANVKASPAFGLAVRGHAERSRSILVKGLEPAFGKYIGDVSNALIEGTIIYFYILNKLENSGSGATLGKLQLIGFVHDFASPRRVSMCIKRLIQVGRLSYAPDPSDKRVRLLIPGRELIANAMAQVSSILSSCGHIWPDSASAAASAADPDFAERIFLNIGREAIGGADPFRPFPDIRFFLMKDSGTFLLNYLVHSGLGGDNRLSSEIDVPVNYTELARHCGATRTHIRNVVEAAAEKGLIDLSGERSLRLTKKFIDTYEDYFACLLILVRTSFLKAKRESSFQPR